MKRKLVLLLLGLLVILPSCAKDYYFSRISTHAMILQNSDILVQENYTYSFDGPFTYVYRSFYLNQIKGIENFAVRNAETNQQYAVSVTRDSESIRFRWDINASDEEQTYVMEYTIVGAIKSYNQTNYYLWYSIVPSDREKLVLEVDFLITFPKGVDTDFVKRVSRASEINKISPDTLELKSYNIEPYGAFDVEFYLPNDMAELYLTQSEILSIAISFLVLALILSGAACFFCLSIKEYLVHGRDPKKRDFGRIPELRPAIAGYIVDEKADVKEIESTILDLAIRGYIYIDEKEVGTIFRRKEISLLKTKTTRGLLDYEKGIVEALFGDKNKIKVSSLKKKFYREIPEITKSIEKEVLKQKLLDKETERIRTDYQKKVIPAIILPPAAGVISIVWAFFAVGAYSKMLSYLSFVSFTFSVFLLVMTAFFQHAIQRKSELGVAHANKYNELREWMKKYPLKEGRIFDEYLPYATALGIQMVWIKKLKGLEGEYKSSWYSGTYSYAHFSALHESLMVSTSPPGSSGGGGFGGGGGAGGGGSGAG
jgi:uncharacterized membrane protein